MYAIYLPTLFHKTLKTNFFHQGILATKPKYYGYTYGELVEQMLDESAPTPHIDITSSALRLLLNFPIGVLKTKYESSTKTRAKKVWKAYWYFPLDADSHLELKNPCCISG